MTVAELIGESPGIIAVRQQAARLVGRPGAGRMPAVLLEGETGTGKGVLARALHAASPRRGAPFVEVNCAAIPETLLEAELFGVERGAFTGADRSRPGLFHAAHGGTLFLDEIALVPEAVQSKLLKAVEERTVRRLGRTASEPVDVWVVAATNEDLEGAVQAKRFRRDLYHRLAVVKLRLPPLRERGADIDLLAEHFLARVCADYGLPRKTLAEAARAALRAHPWPGNVRELGNVIERAGLLSDEHVLTPQALALGPAPGGGQVAGGPPSGDTSLRTLLDGAERDHVLDALNQTEWNLSRAAARLKMPRNTLRYRMERFGLRPPPPSRRRPGPAEVSAAAPPVESGDGDRRRITWLRIDLSAGTVDGHPDTSRALAALVDKVRSFGGCVRSATRSRVVAAFGLEPIDDAPRRAGLTALAIQTAAARARADHAGPWSVAIALHVGDCVVAAGTPAIIGPGDAADVEAELDAVAAGAPPSTIRVSAEAARALDRRFELRAIADGGAAGRVYELGGREHSGFRVRGRVTPLVGRARDLEWLQGRLRTARDGRGQVVGIVGDAGIGKSRLVAELRRDAVAQGCTWLEGRCVAYATTTPYYPIVAMLRQLVGVDDTDDAVAVTRRLEAALDAAGMDPADAMPYLGDLLGASGPTAGVGPEMARARTFEAVRMLLVQVSRSRPLALVVEDAHWIDETSDSLLAELVDSMFRVPLLFVVTYRPGYRPRWMQHSYAAQLSLHPLSEADSGQVVRSMLAVQPVADPRVQAILKRAEGNPFFLEELSRALADDAGTDPVLVPGTVRDVLAGRIARLDDGDRRLLQTAAVIGREVPDALLRAVADEPADLVTARLARLQAAEFLRSTEIGPDDAHTFQHALTCEVAYDSLPSAARSRLHERVGDALEAGTAGHAAEDDEQLARHALGAERWLAAVRYLRRGADKALARSANPEAVALVEQALAALRRLPEDGERSRRELTLQITRGVALIAMHGYGAPAVAEVYERARQLCQDVGQTPRLLGAHLGLWVFHLFRGDVEVARELADQCLAVVRPYPDSPLLGWAHLAAGLSAFWLADFAQARAELEESLALYDFEEQSPLATLYGQDYGVIGRAYLAVLSAATLESPDRSVQHADAALALAERVAHPYTTAGALTLVAAAHLLRREPAEARAHAGRAVDVASEQGFPVWRTMAMVLRGWAAGEEGQADEGIDEMRRGIAAWRSLGSQLAAPWFLTLLAEALGRQGRVDDGLAAIAEALSAAARGQDRWYVPETHRVHGELLRRRGRPTEAEGAARRAVALARRQGVTSLEARAALTLARFHLEDAGRDEARRVLAETCGRIADGIETRDVAAARALLAELG